MCFNHTPQQPDRIPTSYQRFASIAHFVPFPTHSSSHSQAFCEDPSQLSLGPKSPSPCPLASPNSLPNLSKPPKHAGKKNTDFAGKRRENHQKKCQSDGRKISAVTFQTGENFMPSLPPKVTADNNLPSKVTAADRLPWKK